jgi:hypothetical protein
MAFDCLIGLIGIREGDGVTPPESGLYITSLPDITLSEISKISKTPVSEEMEEDDVIDSIWEIIENRGILKFRTLFISEMGKCWKVSKQELAECLICENSMLLATPLWYLLGAELMWERINTPRLNRFTTIDKAQAKVLRGELMELFHTELTTAVAGINIRESECFETECAEQQSYVNKIETQM